MSVLGGILIDNDAINRVLEILGAEDFYRESHRKIFQAMMRLSDQREPCDPDHHDRHAQEAGGAGGGGGRPYLLTLVDYAHRGQHRLLLQDREGKRRSAAS